MGVEENQKFKIGMLIVCSTLEMIVSLPGKLTPQKLERYLIFKWRNPMLKRLKCSALLCLGLIMFQAQDSSALTCVAQSSRGPSYNAPGNGNTVQEAQAAALNVCGPNCNGKKGSLVGWDCTGMDVTCTVHSSRGAAYSPAATGKSRVEAQSMALNICGPNCNGKKGFLAGWTCNDGFSQQLSGPNQQLPTQQFPTQLPTNQLPQVIPQIIDIIVGGQNQPHPGGPINVPITVIESDGSGSYMCVAHSSRGSSYDAPARGSSLQEARATAINTCGPNCNGNKGALIRLSCFGPSVTCTAVSSRGPSYSPSVQNASVAAAKQQAINICGPNCSGSKGSLVRFDCQIH